MYTETQNKINNSTTMLQINTPLYTIIGTCGECVSAGKSHSLRRASKLYTNTHWNWQTMPIKCTSSLRTLFASQ